MLPPRRQVGTSGHFQGPDPAARVSCLGAMCVAPGLALSVCQHLVCLAAEPPGRTMAVQMFFPRSSVYEVIGPSGNLEGSAHLVRVRTSGRVFGEMQIPNSDSHTPTPSVIRLHQHNVNGRSERKAPRHSMALMINVDGDAEAGASTGSCWACY